VPIRYSCGPAGLRSLPLGVIAIAVLIVGCNRTDNRQKSILARNAKWEVAAVGDLTAPSMPFATNVVRFEASRDGAVRATGELYHVGPHDRGFRDQYESTTWVGSDGLMFWNKPSGTVPTYQLSIVNNRPDVINWLRVRTGFELFLGLEIAPRAVVQFTSFRVASRPSFSVQGQSIAGETIDHRELSLSGYADSVEVVVGPSGVTAHLRE
jgi:hypothetical protein